MAWIAFDKKTQTSLSEELGAPVRLADRSTDPLDYALESPHNSVLLVPYGNTEQLVVLTLKKHVREELPPPPDVLPMQEPSRTGHYVSGGFLGLNDEVELEEEPEPRKSWWKKLFE